MGKIVLYVQFVLWVIRWLIPINAVFASAAICGIDVFPTLIRLILNWDIILIFCVRMEQLADHPRVKLQPKGPIFERSLSKRIYQQCK
jgi:hypothetical protein